MIILLRLITRRWGLMENEKALAYLSEVIDNDKIALLRKIGYFTSPASSRYHLSVEGGLAQHSVNVVDTMLSINEKMNLGLQRKDIILAGMLHDLCKVGTYRPNILKSGNVSKVQPFAVNKQFTLGHGAESLYLAINDLDIKLPIYVAEAIYWHMGFKYPDDNGAINTLKKQPIDILFVWLLQTSDLYATWIMEEDNNER